MTAGNIVRPYGDTTGDGMVQVSFTLPVEVGPLAEGAALQLATRMGIDPAMVVHSKAVGPGFTFFVVYGQVRHLVDLSTVDVIEREYPLLPAREVNLAVKKLLRRKLVVVGACIGTDAHTVGIDAILNVKGIAGEKGLEYYREIRVVNLGAQVFVPELVRRSRAEKADAVLVSQVVTQKDAHLHNTEEMSAAFREAMGERRPLLVVGGPRFDPRQAGSVWTASSARAPRRARSPRTSYTRCGSAGKVVTVSEQDPRVGLSVTHRGYVAHGHYGGDLVEGAYVLGVFGDVATELCIRSDGDEGLFAGYDEVRFTAPLYAGDVLEATGTITAVGRRSRRVELEARVVCRADRARSASAATVLASPIVVVRARGTVVVP
jgi:beta-lysine 5,6-aminomutase beta subunit